MAWRGASISMYTLLPLLLPRVHHATAAGSRLGTKEAATRRERTVQCTMFCSAYCSAHEASRPASLDNKETPRQRRNGMGTWEHAAPRHGHYTIPYSFISLCLDCLECFLNFFIVSFLMLLKWFATHAADEVGSLYYNIPPVSRQNA